MGGGYGYGVVGYRVVGTGHGYGYGVTGTGTVGKARLDWLGLALARPRQASAWLGLAC